MLKELIDFLDLRYRMAKQVGDLNSCNNFYHQAFGALDYFHTTHPELRAKVEALWNNTYRPMFERLIWEATT